jgi:hypothetical protein
MNIVQEVRALGIPHEVFGDGEVSLELRALPDYRAYLSLFNGQVWCEVFETYSGSTVTSGVLQTVKDAVNFAKLQSFMFEQSLDAA